MSLSLSGVYEKSQIEDLECVTTFLTHSSKYYFQNFTFLQPDGTQNITEINFGTETNDKIQVTNLQNNQVLYTVRLQSIYLSFSR